MLNYKQIAGVFETNRKKILPEGIHEGETDGGFKSRADQGDQSAQNSA